MKINFATFRFVSQILGVKMTLTKVESGGPDPDLPHIYHLSESSSIPEILKKFFYECDNFKDKNNKIMCESSFQQ